MKRLRQAAVAVGAAALLAMLAGCATIKTGEHLAEQGAADLHQAPECCASWAEAQFSALPPPGERAVVRFDNTRQAARFGTEKAFFAAYQLPRWQQPYFLTLTTVHQGAATDMAMLVPLVVLLDAEFKEVRRFDEKNLRPRGNQLERTVFFNPANQAERYMLVYGAPGGAAYEKDLSIVTATTVSVGAGFFTWYSGHDTKMKVRTSPTGEIEMFVSAPSQ